MLKQQVIVQELMSGGTAAHSGLQPGDVITHIDAEPVGQTPSMPELIRRIKGAPGTAVPVSCSSCVFLIPIHRSCLEGLMAYQPELPDWTLTIGHAIGRGNYSYSVAFLAPPLFSPLIQGKLRHAFKYSF